MNSVRVDKDFEETVGDKQRDEHENRVIKHALEHLQNNALNTLHAQTYLCRAPTKHNKTLIEAECLKCIDNVAMRRQRYDLKRKPPFVANQSSSIEKHTRYAEYAKRYMNSSTVPS